ncbi:MAG: undecaprenyl-diphosphatase UppP [Chloracidobacterium sp.]|uniref:Undecaprenyl-diphosphatase n=1 Tax=Chloracidobacterium validum TaxID=2821543 RepID=A0ABX8BCM8_9BACT|nr:undecaprenyl-diphosphatase UppP [Chloracidobacterium validum]QUW03786.1 undecaprenyl-diphosphatase UppP [Chloracidobacterium validum]
MSILQAILLGIVQGLTEFLPISSTAHLILASKLLQLDQKLTPEQLTGFVAVIQLGTVIALIVYFFPDLWNITRGFLADNLAWMQGTGKLGEPARLGWLIVIGSIPVVVFGFGFKKIIEGVLTKNLYVIAGALVGLALLLTVAEVVGSRRLKLADLTWFHALIIGFGQSVALIPGASRSGTTITAGLLLGLDRATAARFSFLLCVPALTGAGLLQFVREVKDFDTSMLLATAIATVVSGITGYAAIAFLLYFLKTHSLFVFVAYRLILGGLIFLLLATNRIAPV